MPWPMVQAIFPLLTLVVPLGMFNLGLEAGRPHALQLLRKPAPLARYVLVTFVVMPIIALFVASLASVPKTVVEGLVFMSICPPGLGLSKKALKLTGVHQAALAWQALAIPLSVVMIPGFLLLAHEAFGVSYLPGVAAILRKVLTIFLLPLLLGICVRTFLPRAGAALTRLAKPIAMTGQLILLTLIVIVSGPAIGGLGLISILVSVVTAGLAILVGHLLGGPAATSRPILASTVALRWPAPALALAAVNNSTVEVTPVILTYFLAGMVLMVPYQRWVVSQRQSPERPCER